MLPKDNFVRMNFDQGQVVCASQPMIYKQQMSGSNSH